MTSKALPHLLTTKVVPALLVAAALAFACGPRPPVADSASKTKKAGPPVASSLNVSVNDGVQFVFHVSNGTAKSLEFTFPSGQTYDVVVQDTLGAPVWKWSDGRVFTTAMQSRVLASNETMTFDADWNPASMTGEFDAVVTLKSDNRPVEKRIRFSLP